MGLKAGQAKETILCFLGAYMVRRDLEETLSYLTGEVQWIGTGKQEPVCGIAGVKGILLDEFSLEPDGYEFQIEEIWENVIADAGAAVLLAAWVKSAGASVYVCVTAFCIAEEGACRIASIHASTPDMSQEDGAYFPSVGTERIDFERGVEARTLDLLGKSIPGGIMGGYLEPDFPLYYINDRMLKYLDYTYEEFVKDTDGYVINCMHPGDRKRVNRQVEEAFAKDLEYTIRYRMRKKDGSYIWVYDIGKKGIARDGRQVCISVIRDISKEIENEKRAEEIFAERERQANRYNQLFQSVLCGIVQYRVNGDGRVFFENANKEAIRIFGYEEEEFWAKKDWYLPALIMEEDRERVLDYAVYLREIGDKNPYEYRLCRKDGSACWIIGSAELILNAEGQKIIQSVFLDIDGQKRAEQHNRFLADQVEASNEVLHLALEHTATCEFYYYPRLHFGIFPAKFCEYYHTKEEYRNMPESFAKTCVDAEFWEEFCAMFAGLDNGERTASMEFKTKNGNLWCRETLSVISYTEEGKPEFVVGVQEDITHQKEMELALEEARSRDSLTGLYNKRAGLRLAREYMQEKSEQENCTLMFLDMDHFSEVIREEGEAFADAILQEVAAIVTAETESDDIQIRLGGDEFMLLVKNCGRERANLLGARIVDQVAHIIDGPEQKSGISASIGMCVTDVADEFDSLYRCAESALKYVKENGRGKAVCYLDSSTELEINMTQQVYDEEYPAGHTEPGQESKEEDLVSFALELLGKSIKLNDAVFLLLSRIGKKFRFDRVSVLEADREYLSFRFTYQWARRRSDFMLGQDFYVTEEDLNQTAKVYDAEDLCEKNPAPEIFTAASGLHAGIWDCGEYVGDMSFEVNEEHYRFTKEQRKLLRELVKIVPSFYMKAKADAVSKAKTDFLSRMSHEIRTPMNAISGMTAIAKSALDDREKMLDCLEKIETANDYLLNLINDILDMSRIESGKMEMNRGTIRIDQLLDNLEMLLGPQAKKKEVALNIENGYLGSRMLIGDELRLNQVLINITGNAVKFTEPGGTVLVKVEPREQENGVRLFFSVKDTGIGIEPAALKRIFNVFEQAEKETAARYGGTGLGLAISSRLVQLMGGTLEVKSRVKEGSEFYFTLPFDYAKEEAQKTQEEKRAPERDFTGKRLLLAEDNEINQKIAETLLTMNGFLVECVSDGSQALERFEGSTPGYYDGILMDIRMPVMDGLEATRRIRTLGHRDSRSIPIIALSANAFDEDSKKSLESGMNGHLAKPFQIKQLLELLARVL